MSTAQAAARIAAHLAAVRRLHRGDVVVETDFNENWALRVYGDYA